VIIATATKNATELDVCEFVIQDATIGVEITVHCALLRLLCFVCFVCFASFALLRLLCFVCFAICFVCFAICFVCFAICFVCFAICFVCFFVCLCYNIIKIVINFYIIKNKSGHLCLGHLCPSIYAPAFMPQHLCRRHNSLDICGG
jgi:hypothetical protein